MRRAGIQSASRTFPVAFQYKELDGNYLVTNPFGDWCWLSKDDFREYVEGSLSESCPAYSKLKAANLIQDGFDRETLIERMADWKSFLQVGPTVHNIALSQIDGDDLPAETGQRVIDTAFMSTADRIHLQFCSVGSTQSEALLIQLVDYARKKNQIARKQMTIALQTSGEIGSPTLLSWLGTEMIQWDITLYIHSSISETTDAVYEQISEYNSARRLNASHEECVSATVELVEHSTPVANLYATLEKISQTGTRRCWVRPFNELDATKLHLQYERSTTIMNGTWGQILEKWISKPLDLVEMYSAILLGRLMNHRDNPVTRLRNPAMDGIGTFAYDTDGNVYTSARGRELGTTGDPAFLIGSVHRSGYHDLVVHPTVRSIVMATTLEGQPGWSSSPYSAFCGSDPVLNYLSHGSIQGRMPESQHAKWQEQVLDFVFAELRKENETAIDLFRQWTEMATAPLQHLME